MTKGQFTREEIASQPATWASVLTHFEQERPRLESLVREGAKQQFIVTGCGSTYYLSISAATHLRQHGISAWAYPGSEILHFTETMPQKDVWLLAISRSGATTETLWAVDRFRQHAPGGKVIAITCSPDSELVHRADISLVASDAQENSIVQTRSFTSMFLLSQALAAILTGKLDELARLKTLPDRLSDLLVQTEDLSRTLGEDLSLQRFFFLGGGPFYGLASEAMLKMKETSLTWSEAYHPLEFRHGPISVVDSEALVVGFLSDSGFEAETSVLRQVKETGGRTVMLAEDISAFTDSDVDHAVALRSGLSEWERGALYLPIIHWMVYYRGLKKSLDPDRPTNLAAVVELK
jgi:glucosamine--fructose-6-phosphate aminotransferase (isomerizing)